MIQGLRAAIYLAPGAGPARGGPALPTEPDR